MKKKFRLTTITITCLILSIIIIMATLINNIDTNNHYKAHYNRLSDLYSKANLKTTNFEKETLKSIEETKDSLALAEYYDAITRYYILNNDIQKAEIYSYRTMDEYSKVKNGDNYSLNAFKNASILDICESNSNRSLNYYDRMLDISKKEEVIKNSNFTKEDIEGLSHAMLSIFYDKINNFDKANECFKFLNNMDNQKIHDKEIRYIISYAKSMYNIRWGDMKKAEEGMVALSKQIDNESMKLDYIKPAIYLNTSIIQIVNGNFKNSLVDINKTIKLNNDVKNNILIECYIAYGFYYDRQNIFDKAKDNYEKALSLSEKLANNVGAIRSVGALIALCERNNKYIDTELYYKKFWELSNAKENSVESYVTNIIDLNNQLNNERFSIIENEKKLEIEKRKILNLALIVTVTVLILLSLGTYKLYRETKLRKESESKLKEIINEDYLTKAYTRGYAYKNLKHMIESKESICLAMADLDDYKKINDTFGHNIGDRVLADFVELCKFFIADNGFIARFGGEEFLIILKDKTKEEAIEIVENIRTSLENKEWEIKGLKVTVSMGLVYNEYEEVDELIKKADELLYTAKRTGKNKVQV